MSPVWDSLCGSTLGFLSAGWAGCSRGIVILPLLRREGPGDAASSSEGRDCLLALDVPADTISAASIRDFMLLRLIFGVSSTRGSGSGDFTSPLTASIISVTPFALNMTCCAASDSDEPMPRVSKRRLYLRGS